MTALLITATTTPRSLLWWQWGKVMGVVLPIVLAALGVADPFLWALAAHLFVDFTSQSTHTAVGKGNGDWLVLIYHSFISGGYPGLILGGLPGLFISFLIHLAIDASKKFGLPDPWGPAADQAAHFATLLALAMIF